MGRTVLSLGKKGSKMINFSLLFGLPLLFCQTKARRYGVVWDDGKNELFECRSSAESATLFDARTSKDLFMGYFQTRETPEENMAYRTTQNYRLPSREGRGPDGKIVPEWHDMVAIQDHKKGHPEFGKDRAYPHFHVRAARTPEAGDGSYPLKEWIKNKNGKNGYWQNTGKSIWASDNTNIPRAREHYFYKKETC